MFDRIDFYIHGDKIEIGGKEFLLGELTADIMSISPDEFREMNELVQTENDEKPLHRLHGLLMKRTLFGLIAKQDTLGTMEQYQQIVSDIYSFNQTIFYFTDQFLTHLKKLDSENYAAALFDFYNHPGLEKMMVNHFRSGIHRFTLFDEIQVHYLPREIPRRAGEYAIYEVYSVKYLQGFLKMDFMKALMVGHVIRRCKNCGRFFLQPHGYKTDYCDRPLPDKPHRNCRNQGPKNIAKEKAANNPVIQSCERAYQRVSADYRRERISPDERDKARQRLIDLRDEAISGKHRDAEADALMQREALYDALGITRRGGR